MPRKTTKTIRFMGPIKTLMRWRELIAGTVFREMTGFQRHGKYIASFVVELSPKDALTILPAWGTYYSADIEYIEL